MVNIVVTGDFCPDFSKSETTRLDPFKEIFGNFPDTIEGKDLHITNLECPLTSSTDRIIKDGPSIRASVEMIEALKYARTDVVCLANNHILDFGTEGLLDTINVCEKNGIKTVGAGKDLTDASRVLYLSVKNKTIAIVNITQHEFSIAYKDSAGANPLNPVRNFYSICEARKNSSIVLVIVHGGNEEYPLPSERIVDTYRFFADIGASAVISHHAHCISGFEVYNDVPIFYGLGNFIFELAGEEVPDSWYTGLMLSLNINSDDKITFELKPFYQFKKGIGFKFLEGAEKDSIMKEIDHYSEIVKDRKLLKQHWTDFSERSRNYYYAGLNGFGPIRRRLFKFPLMQKWIFPLKKKIVMYDMIKCESHNDVISELLINDILKE